MFRQAVDLMTSNPLSFGAMVLAVALGGTYTASTSTVGGGTTTTRHPTTLLEKSNMYTLATGIIILVIGLSVHFYDSYCSNRNDRHREERDDNKKDRRTAAAATTTSSSSVRLKNIWETGRSRDSPNNNNGGGKTHKEKPFGSKYYYAHNNPNATGGYKDGLKLEDYQMNGPRLLSKGGQPVETTTSTTTGTADSSSDESNGTDREMASSSSTSVTMSTMSKTRESPGNEAMIPINKYLWDDEGDSNGIATIRIEVLPDPNSTTVGRYIDCKDMTLSDATVALAGEGLIFGVSATVKKKKKKSNDDGDGVKDDGNNGSAKNEDDNVDDDSSPAHRYQLKIPKLYGDAADVKLILKPKRILIKIHKKKNSFLSTFGIGIGSNGSGSKGRSNLDAWPQPHRKI